ncbi:MAG TPA: trans-aconitate 2-methyltransferase [Streptosporangiaceae bacterium]|jgi:trans-aconitate 2-methyltransferase|nr:trans-aconitate 2-methyltransferase [Streptosporangiaceae bacterium]
MWDPAQYLRFAGERSRPFYELLARVGAEDPQRVADLGCGPGELTAELAARWPAAEVTGLDSSAEMISAARAHQVSAAVSGRESGSWDTGSAAPAPEAQAGAFARIRFVLGDLRDWQPAEPHDVIVSNAVLQWLPDHLEVLARWPKLLARGGWLAVQVPGNFDQPSHQILRDLAGSPRWRPLLRDVPLNRQSAEPAQYLDLLARAGCEVDAWETMYQHVLHGDDPVVEWYKGSGLRPVLAALDPAQAAEFLAEYGAETRAAYPRRPYGTVLAFRRVFVVARAR